MAEQKGKYQPWSHEEFLADRKVRRMSSLARKTYMTILHEAWVCETRPDLPNDEEDLELMADCESREEWLKIRSEIMPMFQEEGDVLVNKRLRADWERLQEIRQSRKDSGRKGGIAKAGKHPSPKTEISANAETEENTEMKAEKHIEILCQQFFGKRANLRGWNGDELKKLELIHKGSAVIRAFGEWAQQNDDNPDIQDPVREFLNQADDYLASETPATQVSNSPEVTTLVRELTYLSGDRITFSGSQKVALGGLLAEYSFLELVGAFRTFLEGKDLDDARDVKFAASNFVSGADGLCYSARRRKQEQEAEARAREEAAARLQQEAEAERLKVQDAEPEFDPLQNL